jgi:hypothetical protein
MNENSAFHSDTLGSGIPYELRRQAPREVELTGAGKTVVVFMAALLLGAVALGVFLYALRNRELARDAELDARGVTVQARVIDKGITAGKAQRRFVVFRYSVQGRLYERRVTFPRSDKRPVEIGSDVEIRYMPLEPGESWLAGYGPEGPPLVIVFLIPAILAGCCFLTSYTLRRQRRLLSEGRAAIGTVTEWKGFRRGRQSGYAVEYEFRLLSGATQRSKVETRKKPPEAGATATILYDPDNPKKIAVYPMQMVRIAKN